MTLVVVAKATLNQCRVMWNKITVVAAKLFLVKKGNHVDLLGG